MNLSTIALLLIAWQVFSGNNDGARAHDAPRRSPLDNISDFLSEDTKNIISCVNKLTDSQCSQQDKTGAIFQMMTNPAVMNVASSFFGGGTGAQQEQPKQNEQADGMQNSEGYKFEQSSPASQEFFRPIDNIADAEVKHKLYWFYDNWYVK